MYIIYNLNDITTTVQGRIQETGMYIIYNLNDVTTQ